MSTLHDQYSTGPVSCEMVASGINDTEPNTLQSLLAVTQKSVLSLWSWALWHTWMDKFQSHVLDYWELIDLCKIAALLPSYHGIWFLPQELWHWPFCVNMSFEMVSEGLIFKQEALERLQNRSNKLSPSSIYSALEFKFFFAPMTIKSFGVLGPPRHAHSWTVWANAWC